MWNKHGSVNQKQFKPYLDLVLVKRGPDLKVTSSRIFQAGTLSCISGCFLTKFRFSWLSSRGLLSHLKSKIALKCEITIAIIIMNTYFKELIQKIYEIIVIYTYGVLYRRTQQVSAPILVSSLLDCTSAHCTASYEIELCTASNLSGPETVPKLS